MLKVSLLDVDKVVDRFMKIDEKFYDACYELSKLDYELRGLLDEDEYEEFVEKFLGRNYDRILRMCDEVYKSHISLVLPRKMKISF